MPSTGYLPAAAIDGPATVMNPEMRKRQEAALTESSGAFESDLSRRLFPADHSSINLDSPPSPAGCRLGHFRIEEMIGRGGMGAVFRAIDERLDRVVALKVLAPNYSRDPSTVERFRNEAKSAARLDHENIARVFYTGEDRGVNFIAHEFVTGTNLRDLIRERGRLSPEEAVNYTLQMAAALRHTSSAGVVHRDIKPSNIIITPAGRAKLVDLGLARKEYSEATAELTVAGTTLGTFDYISPEQAKDPRDVDVRSDIYSLGCTLYHMLTGEPPYPEGTFFKRLLDRHDKAPPSPALKAPGVSSELAAVTQRMMAAQPRMRYSSAENLISDLLQVAAQLGLRGIQPEGLVWASGSQLQKNRFLERNVGLLVSLAALLLIVFAIDRFSRNDVVSRDGQNGRLPTKTGLRSNDGSNIALKTDSSPGAVPSKSGKSESTAPERIEKPNPLTIGNRDDEADVLQGASVIVAGLSEGADLLQTGSSATIGKTGGGETVPPTPASMSERPFKLLSNDGTPPKSFASLEAAFSTAEQSSSNGQIVVLNYDGIRLDQLGLPVEEKPIRITKNKSITLRAADGRRPTIVFAVTDSIKSQMITLSNGTLNIIDVGIVFRVPDRPGDNPWSLFALQGHDHLDLKGVHITLENQTRQIAAVIDISQNPTPKLPKNMMMKKEGAQPPDQFEITIRNSFFRCDSHLLTVNQPRAGRLNIQDSAAVLADSLLQVSCAQPADSAFVELKLQHTTVIAGKAVISNSGAGSDQELDMPIQVTTAKDNLFVSKSQQPFIAMASKDNLKNWEGGKNFYSRFDPFISIKGDQFEPLTSKDIKDWKNDWGKNEDTQSGKVVWKRDWIIRDKAASSFSADDLEIDMTDESSKEKLDGTDGQTVGANLAKLPSLSSGKPAGTPPTP